MILVVGQLSKVTPFNREQALFHHQSFEKAFPFPSLSEKYISSLIVIFDFFTTFIQVYEWPARQFNINTLLT